MSSVLEQRGCTATDHKNPHYVHERVEGRDCTVSVCQFLNVHHYD